MSLQIPAITDPLGRYWDQPDRSKITLDDTHAMMDETTFYELATYNTTKPSVVYPGKMWKRQYNTLWYLFWYHEDDGDPRGLLTPHRQIIII